MMEFRSIGLWGMMGKRSFWHLGSGVIRHYRQVCICVCQVLIYLNVVSFHLDLFKRWCLCVSPQKKKEGSFCFVGRERRTNNTWGRNLKVVRFLEHLPNSQCGLGAINQDYIALHGSPINIFSQGSLYGCVCLNAVLITGSLIVFINSGEVFLNNGTPLISSLHHKQSNIM